MPALADVKPAQFVRANTRLAVPGLTPEVRLHLADDPWPLWEATERAFGVAGLPPPFWAFAWAGGQALARYVLDHPGVVAGRRVLDLATGSGLVAIAAGKAGAATVTATDIDPFAVTAATLNAAANGVTIDATYADVLTADDSGDARTVLAGERAAVDTVLVADAFYEKELAARVLRFLERAAVQGVSVFAADIGRRYLPRHRFRELAVYDVPVPRVLEDAEVKRTAVLAPAW